MDKSHRKKILLVEGDSDLREQLREVLDCEGYEPVCTSCHKDALQYLESSAPPSVILFDCAPPCQSGKEFIKGIKQLDDGDHKKVPLLLMYSDNLIHQKYANSDVSEFLSKPVDLDHFLNAVGRWSEPDRRVA